MIWTNMYSTSLLEFKKKRNWPLSSAIWTVQVQIMRIYTAPYITIHIHNRQAVNVVKVQATANVLVISLFLPRFLNTACS